MCNKCEVFHSKLLKNHQSIILGKNEEEIFTGLCEEENHQIKLEFFCKTHNKLCCAFCLCKIKKKERGTHKDCDACDMEDIKEEKLNKLKENIKILENLSNGLQESIDKFKNIYEKMNENKEKLKVQIQKVFTKIRNELNNREEEILLDLDKKFENLFLNENYIKNIEKLPNKTKKFIEKGNSLDKIDIHKELSLFIHECINIENNLKDINIDYDNLKKFNNNYDNFEIKFFPKEEDKNELIKDIKNFGQLNFLNKKNKDNLFSLSTIINNDIDKQNCVLNWIKEKVNKNEINIELIFKMSKNGYKSEDFHKMCDNKGPSLSLVKTTKNKLFGGFTPLSWNSQDGYLFDPSNQTFIFSLNLMKKFDIINPKKTSIECFKTYGIIFGDHDFSLKENMKNGCTYSNSYCNFLSNENLELTGGKGKNEDFEAEEFEVYKVIY